MQREYQRDLAFEAKSNMRPPEMRIAPITYNGKLKLEFTEPINFPELDLFRLENEVRDYSNKLLEL